MRLQFLTELMMAYSFHWLLRASPSRELADPRRHLLALIPQPPSTHML